MNDTIEVDQKDRELLQWLQDEFPVTERPWLAGGAKLGMTEEEVLSRMQRLSAGGIIRTVHTILQKPKKESGNSTLIVMRVPEENIPDTIPVINNYPSVTHNFLREHEYNLWFTVNTGSEQELERTIAEIKQRTGVRENDILDLRTVKVFKTDVRFRFFDGAHITRTRRDPPIITQGMDEIDRTILSTTQHGIPLAVEPFRKISEQSGVDQGEVLSRLDRQVRQGIIKRIGGSFNQRKLGITANAVVAWKVPENLVEDAGKKLSLYDEVTHCYERRTVPGVWDYNMFTVMHGYDRQSVETCAERLAGVIGNDDYRVIFSTRQFKRTSIIHDLQTISQNEQRCTMSREKCCSGDAQ